MFIALYSSSKKAWYKHSYGNVIKSRFIYLITFFFTIGAAYVAKYVCTKVPTFAAIDMEALSAKIIASCCFGLFAMHFTLGMCMVGARNSSAKLAFLHNGWWPLKFLMLVVFVACGFFVMGTAFLGAFWYVAVLGASLYIVAEMFGLLALAYDVNERLVAKVDEGEKAFSIVLLVLTVTAGIGNLVFLVLCFMCATTVPVIVAAVHLLLLACQIFLVFVYPLRECNPNLSVLPPLITSLGSGFVLYSAVQCVTHPNDSMPAATSAFVFYAFFGVLFLTLASETVTVSIASGKVVGESPESPSCGTGFDNSGDGIEDYNYSMFHVLFMLAALCIYPISESWNGASPTATQFGVWCRVSVVFLNSVLMVGTQVMPYLLRNRDFS